MDIKCVIQRITPYFPIVAMVFTSRASMAWMTSTKAQFRRLIVEVFESIAHFILMFLIWIPFGYGLVLMQVMGLI